MKFTSIDFEKATNDSCSVCSIGLAVFENDKLIFSAHWLVRPPNNEYLNLHKSIHGITEEDTCESPSFVEIWDELRPFIENQIVIAHNGATVEFPILEQLFAEYEIPVIHYEKVCTYQISKLLFPYINNHKLSTISKMLGIEFDDNKHHNSQFDAEKCGEIFIKMKNFFRLNEKYLPDYYVSKKSKNLNPVSAFEHKKVKSEFLTPNPVFEGHFFHQKKVVITGEFESFYKNRNKLAEILCKCGADINTSISSKTDIALVGKKPGDSKLKKIESLKIYKMEEDELIELIKDIMNG